MSTFFVGRCNNIRASWETKQECRFSYRKKHTEEFVQENLFLDSMPSFLCHFLLLSFYVIFCFFLCLLAPPFQATYLLNVPIKIHSISIGGISVMISWVNSQKYENLLSFNTRWLPLVTLVIIWSFFKNWLPSTNLSDSFHLKEKPLNKRKQFALSRKSVSTSPNEELCWKRRFH